MAQASIAVHRIVETAVTSVIAIQKKSCKEGKGKDRINFGVKKDKEYPLFRIHRGQNPINVICSLVS